MQINNTRFFIILLRIVQSHFLSPPQQVEAADSCLKLAVRGLKSVGCATGGLHFSGAKQAVRRSVKRKVISHGEISADSRGNWLMKPISCSTSTSRSLEARKECAFSRIFRR